VTVRQSSASGGSALYRLRTAAGLSQHEVAEQLNRIIASELGTGGAVTAHAVSRWERGVNAPAPRYRRFLAQLFRVGIDELALPADPPSQPTAAAAADPLMDPRVIESQERWRATRKALNARRGELSRFVARAYGGNAFGDTGVLTCPAWLPERPMDLARVDLRLVPDAPVPTLDGTEPETLLVRPQASLTRAYNRYTQGIRDIDQPRLFENRPAWRLLDVAPWGDGGSLTFGPTTYFAAVDVFEVLAHETAYVHLVEDGGMHGGAPTLRDLPFRRLVGDPFDCTRRPIMPAVDTLTIRRDPVGGDSFILHRRDSARVAVAGGMLQVIPSGVFQPSSVHPSAQESDFDLWRNIMREYSEELLGNREHDGDGYPVRYDVEPFTTLDRARANGDFRAYFLGLALDALTLAGEVLTVLVIDASTFDTVSNDFVDRNDEGSVLNERFPFTELGVSDVLESGRLAPAGAACISLAWRHRDVLLR
jgi:transcriptional regulator with XRE-family HTH domain